MVDLTTRELYKTYHDGCLKGGLTPKSIKSFKNKHELLKAMGDLNGKEVGPTEPRIIPRRKTLTNRERNALRRLVKNNVVEHVWGARWDVDEALKILAKHVIPVGSVKDHVSIKKAMEEAGVTEDPPDAERSGDVQDD